MAYASPFQSRGGLKHKKLWRLCKMNKWVWEANQRTKLGVIPFKGLRGLEVHME